MLRQIHQAGWNINFPACVTWGKRRKEIISTRAQGNAVPLLPQEFCERAAVFSSNYGPAGAHWGRLQRKHQTTHLLHVWHPVPSLCLVLPSMGYAPELPAVLEKTGSPGPIATDPHTPQELSGCNYLIFKAHFCLNQRHLVRVRTDLPMHKMDT